MQRDIRGEGSNRQKNVESQGNNILHHGHGAESLLKDVGQRDEDQRRSAIGLHPYRHGSRENHQSCQNSHERIDDGNLEGCTHQVRFPFEIAGVGTETSHGNTE